MPNDREAIRKTFNTHFGVPEFYCFSPGRANILGEHIDYNGGTVLPFAISQGIYFFASKTAVNETKIYAADTDEWYNYADEKHTHGWSKYVDEALALYQFPFGLQICFGGDLPIGAGLSSSSALVCGLIYLLDSIQYTHRSPSALLHDAIRIERGNGLLGGTMDQTAIFYGRKDHCLVLDSKTNDFAFEQLPADWHFYLFDTNVKHELVQSDYNVRSEECKEALHLINMMNNTQYKSLTDITISTLDRLSSILPIHLLQRVTYAVEEQLRVIAAINAIRQCDINTMGALMYQGHYGLQHLYAVSWPEADWLVEAAQRLGISGARMMGGGFGGCTINLTAHTLKESDIHRIKDEFSRQINKTLGVYKVMAMDGILTNPKDQIVPDPKNSAPHS